MPTQNLGTEVPGGNYWLNVKVQKFQGSYMLLCNGFPVEKMWVNVQEYDEEWAADMQTALIGEGNVASVRIRPYLQHSGTQLTIGTVQLEAWVEIEETRESYVPLHRIDGAEGEGRLRSSAVDSARTQWEREAKTKWQEYLKSEPTPGQAYRRLQRWRLKNPMEVKTTEFTNRHGPDFSRIFEEAPVIEGGPQDTARLNDYAMRLRDLMARKDTTALFEEFRLYYAQQYRITGYPGGVEENKEAIIDNVVMEYPGDLQFGRDEIQLRRWSGGRVWELRRKSGEALFESDNSLRDVYVAEIDGDLKVVR